MKKKARVLSFITTILLDIPVLAKQKLKVLLKFLITFTFYCLYIDRPVVDSLYQQLYLATVELLPSACSHAHTDNVKMLKFGT